MPKLPDTTLGHRAITLVFAVHGALAGGYFTRIPWIRDHLGLTPTTLGVALVFPAIGGCLAMPTAGRVVHRLGSRNAVRVLLALFAAAAALPALAPSLALLCAAQFLSGAAAGMADVAMNANGVQLEERVGRPIMSGLHGAWSVGALAGSGVGAVAAGAGLDARIQLSAMAAALLLLTAHNGRHLLDVVPDAQAQAPPRFALPSRQVLRVGVVGVCAIVVEMASADWSGVYLRDVAHAAPGLAAASYTAFACTMAATRLVGNLVVGRLGPVRTVAGGAALAMLGNLLVVTARTPAPAVVGFSLVGIGIAVIVPLAFASVGRIGANPGQAIAGMATLVYAAGLVAPAAIGGIAGATSLPVSFALLTVVASVPLVRAAVLRPPAAEPEQSLPLPALTGGSRSAGGAEPNGERQRQVLPGSVGQDAPGGGRGVLRVDLRVD